MQSLSRHLKPAPYPYGLLTLRLLGKLGGKNRQFLREPMLVCGPKSLRDESNMFIKCSWSKVDDAMDVDGEEKDDGSNQDLSLRLPLGRCLAVLRSLSLSQSAQVDAEVEVKNYQRREDISRLWGCGIEDFDVAAYSKDVIDGTKGDQAWASLAVIRTAIKDIVGAVGPEEGSGATADEAVDTKRVCIGLLHACVIEETKGDAWTLLKDLVPRINHATLAESIASFVSEPSSQATDVGKELLQFLLGLREKISGEGSCPDSALFDSLISSLCNMCCLCDWGRQAGPQELICFLVTELGIAWSRKHEVKLINAALLPLKTIPREVSSAAIRSLRVFIRVCTLLYGEQWSSRDDEGMLLRDLLSVSVDTVEKEGKEVPDEKEDEQVSEEQDSKAVADSRGIRPCDEVFRIVIFDLASPQQLVRCVIAQIFWLCLHLKIFN